MRNKLNVPLNKEKTAGRALVGSTLLYFYSIKYLLLTCYFSWLPALVVILQHSQQKSLHTWACVGEIKNLSIIVLSPPWESQTFYMTVTQ